MRGLYRNPHGGRSARRLFATVTLALVAVALAVTAGAAVSAPGEKSALPAKVTVGVLTSLTGPAGFCGTEEAQGIALAVKEAKRKKFLGKTQIELKTIDDRSNVDAGVNGMNQLLDQNVTALLGPCFSPVANVILPIAVRNGLPVVVTTSTAADVTPENIFRSGIPQTRYAFQVIKILKKRGVKKVSVFWDTSVPTAKEVWERSHKLALRNLKIEVAHEEAVPVASTGLADFTSQVGRMLRERPDAIGLIVSGAPNLTMVRQIRQAGFRGIIYGQQGMLAPFFMNGGPDVKGVLVSVAFAPGIGPPSAKNFAKRFEQRYGRPPTELGAHGYDAAWLFMRALKKANSTDKAKVIAALKSIKSMPGAQGNLRFNGVGDAVGTGFVAEFQGDGTIKGITK